MKTPHIILEQIDKAVNPNRNLGVVKTNKPIVLNYRDKEDVVSNDNINVTWKKRYYSYNRGDYFLLDFYSFTSFFGKIYRTDVKGNYGNFSDFYPAPYSNVQYSVDVYVEQQIKIGLSLSLSRGSVTIFVNTENVYSSPEDSYYISGKHHLTLNKGWNNITIFVYHAQDNGKIMLGSEIGKRIAAWRAVDFLPPDPPTWQDTPLEVQYVNPTISSELQVALFWQNSKYQTVNSDVRGWGVYRYERDSLKNTDGTDVLIVSGWGDYGFIVSGDKRNYFSSQMEVGPGTAAIVKVSGSSYHTNDDETLVILSGSGYNFDLFSGYSVSRYTYRHLFDKEFDVTLGPIVSGIDNKDLNYGNVYKYALDAFDDSINKNRSEKTDIKSIVFAYSSKPPKVTAGDVIITNGGLKRITTTIRNPDRWITPPAINDIRGYRVWTSANPDTTNKDNYLVQDVPINTSGSNTTITITETISGSNKVPLDDKTSYTFYLSTYNWFGNSILNDLPSISATTNVYIKTDPGDTRIEMDSDTNSIRLYVTTAEAV